MERLKKEKELAKELNSTELIKKLIDRIEKLEEEVKQLKEQQNTQTTAQIEVKEAKK